MRKLIALFASTAALLVSGVASAAPVDIYLTQDVPGVSTTWTLTASTPDPVTVNSFALQIASLVAGGSFAITNALVSPFTPTGYSTNVTTANNVRLALIPVGVDLFTGPVVNFLLGVYTGSTSAANLTLNPADPQDGETVYDSEFNGLPYVFHIVPEPSLMVLIGAGLAGFALIRRKA